MSTPSPIQVGFHTNGRDVTIACVVCHRGFTLHGIAIEGLADAGRSGNEEAMRLLNVGGCRHTGAVRDAPPWLTPAEALEVERDNLRAQVRNLRAELDELTRNPLRIVPLDSLRRGPAATTSDRFSQIELGDPPGQQETPQ